MAEHHGRTVARPTPRNLTPLPLVALSQIHVHSVTSYQVAVRLNASAINFNGAHHAP
jgi:hypothetical protein